MSEILFNSNNCYSSPEWFSTNQFFPLTCKMQKNDVIAASFLNGTLSTFGSDCLFSDADHPSFFNDITSDLCDDGLTLRIDENLSFEESLTDQNSAVSSIPSIFSNNVDLSAVSSLVESSNFLEKSNLSRQSSLSIVMDVLGSLPNTILSDMCATQQFSEKLSPSIPSSENQDKLNQQNLSQSLLHECMLPQPMRNRTVSESQSNIFSGQVEKDIRQRFYSADNSCVNDIEKSSSYIFCKDSNVSTDSDKNAPASTSVQEQGSENTSSSTPEVAINGSNTSYSENVPVSENTPTLSSLPSFLMKIIENPPTDDSSCYNSLDMDGMLDEFLDSTEQENKIDIEKSQEFVAGDHTYFSKRKGVSTDNSTSKMSSNQTPYNRDASSEKVVDLTENSNSCSSSTTPKMKRTPSYIKRRTQNNRACRESRRKRKAERDEAEMKLAFFTKDNEDMRKKIQELELKVKETRSLLLSRMTKNCKS